MNLITHYIKEIHNVQVKQVEEFSVVVVDMTTNSYGCIERRDHIFSNMDEWEKVRIAGQFEA